MKQEIENISSPPQFPDFNRVLKEFADKTLSLNRVQEISRGGGVVTTVGNTWISSTRRDEDGTFEITIGEQALPVATLARWKWGVNNQEGQFLIKMAHEYAHIVQKHFDPPFLQWLDGVLPEIPAGCEKYARLYLALSESGQLTGLASEGIYHSQSAHTGNLSMPVYEDMAQLIGARLLGKEYFAFRIQHVAITLPSDILEGIGNLVDQIIEEYIREN